MTLDEKECRLRFEGCRVSRLATVGRDGRPHLVPVTFAVDDDVVVVAVDHKPKTTTALRRLRNLAENPAAAFLADEYVDDWSQLWWVRVDAEAHVLDGGPEWTAAVDRLLEKYPQYRERRPEGPVIWSSVTRWSGWAAS